MEGLLNIGKVVVLSLVEGITEFLPVSSTGHLVLVNEFLSLEPVGFANAFNIIIQLGAILSVVVLYWKRLNPWHFSDPSLARLPKSYQAWNKQTKIYYRLTHMDPKTLDLWKRVLIAIIPAGILGFLFDDLIDHYLMTPPVVIATLILYGLLMIAVERWNKTRKTANVQDPTDFSYRMAFSIGLFQCLALVPGTSRSAATIIGAMVLGAGRTAAAEFSFFLAIPTMLGATALKILKNLGGFSLGQWLLILLGFVLSFLVAYVVIKRFMDYIQKRDFQAFGYYRIGLALILLLLRIFL